MTYDVGPKHDALPWSTPAWAKLVVQLCQDILRNQERMMATEADLSAGIDQLNSLVDTLISELQTALNNNANSGAIPNADIQGLLDKVNAERDKVNAALSAGATPTAPAPGSPTGVTEPAPPGSVINADPRATRP